MNFNKSEEFIDEKILYILLGLTFLIVFLLSLLFPIITSSITGTPFSPIPVLDILNNVANNVLLMRISIVIQMLTSLGIILLAILLFNTFKDQNRILAQLALGWWIAEAVTIILEIVGLFGIISLSLSYSSSITPGEEYYLLIANFMYHNLYDYAFIIHNIFFSLGAIIWYYLFYKKKISNKFIPIWGLVSVTLLFLSVIISLYDPEINLFFLNIPYVPFEPVIGSWFIYKGYKS